MQWRKSFNLAASVLCGCLFLPAVIGCDEGDQQVREEVLEVETPEGEDVPIRDGELNDNVNIDVQRND